VLSKVDETIFLKLENLPSITSPVEKMFKFLSTGNKWNESDKVDLFIFIHKYSIISLTVNTIART